MENKALSTTSPPLSGAWTYRYDAGDDEKNYSRALLGEAQLAKAKSCGKMDIKAVRDLVRRNINETAQDARGESYSDDADLIQMIDVGVDFPVFIEGDNVFTREELYETYPFEALHTTPESVFAQQELGLFEPESARDVAELVARDLGDTSTPFVRTRHLVRLAGGGSGAKLPPPPSKIVKTKVFLARARWTRFKESWRMLASINDFVRPALLSGGGTLFALADRVVGSMPRLRLGDGRAAPPAAAPGGDERVLALADRALALDAKELALGARELAVREGELAARESELAARELALGAKKSPRGGGEK